MLEQVAEGGRRRRSAGRPRPRCGSAPAARWGRACRRRRSAGGRRGARRGLPARSAVAIRSMSLQVSAQRLTEPATSTRLAAGCSRSAAASSSAIGRTFESSSRPGPSPGSPSRSSAARTFSSDLRPEPFQLADPVRASAAALRSSTVAIPSSSKRRRAVFVPSPGTRVTSISVVGNFAFSFTAAGISPGLQQGVDLFRQRLADAGDLGRAPGGGELGDRDRALADRLGGGAVGEHPVFDRAVELVEHAQLVQGGGDLGIGHRCNLTPGRILEDGPLIVAEAVWRVPPPALRPAAGRKGQNCLWTATLYFLKY